MENLFKCANRIKSKKSKVAVWGIYNIDIVVRPQEKTEKLCDPANIALHMGGVGRNVALAMKLLGCEVDFFTALNADNIWGATCKQELEKAGVKVHSIAGGNNCFCAIEEVEQEGQAVKKRLKKGYYDGVGVSWGEKILQWQAGLTGDSQYDAVILESALLQKKEGQEAFFALSCCGIKVALLGTASDRGCLENLLTNVYLLQVNREEIKELTGCEVNNESAEVLCRKMMSLRIKHILLSLAAAGVVFGSGGKCEHIVPDNAAEEMINSMGAGDSLFSGTLAALLADVPLKEAVKFGMLCAEYSCKTEEMVSTELEKLASTD